jgi:hypothetical protein
MNLLIISDSKTINNVDESFNLFKNTFKEYYYLCTKALNSNLNSIEIIQDNFEAQLKDIIISKKINVIYLRTDWFFETFKIYSSSIIKIKEKLNVPFILGYHCHTAKLNHHEITTFTNADGFVLINQESLNYFQKYFCLDKKNVFLMDSIYLPKNEWYKKDLKNKLSKQDGKLHCVIPSSVLRISALPSKIDPYVAVENYILDRYDYLQIIQKIASERIHVHLYGEFVEYGIGKSKRIELIYKKYCNSPYIHYEGNPPSEEFIKEISQYDFCILNGFLPNQIVPEFDQMNYQIRFQSVLAAELPIAVAKNTAKSFEKIIERSKIGIIFNNFSELNNFKFSDKIEIFKSNIIQEQIKHSFEYYVSSLSIFLKNVSFKNQKNIFIKDNIEYYDKKLEKNLKNDDKLTFYKNFNIFFTKLNNLKDHKSTYLIYGYSSVGKIIATFLESQVLCFIDMKGEKSTSLINNISVYSHEIIDSISFDYIIISLIGREEEISNYLIEELQIPKEKIIICS